MKKSISVLIVFSITFMAGVDYAQKQGEWIQPPGMGECVSFGEKEATNAVLTITKTYHYEIRTSESESEIKSDTGCTTKISKRLDLEDVIEATVKINLKSSIVLTAFYANETLVSYTPVSAELTNFTLRYNKTKYDYRNTSGSDCDTSRGFESTLINMRSITNEPAIFGVLGPDFQVSFDTKTNKPLRMMPRAVGINYGYHETETLNYSKWPKNDPKRSYTRNWEMRSCLLNLKPVDEKGIDHDNETSSTSLREFMKGKINDKALNNVPDLPIYLHESSLSSRSFDDLEVKTGDGKTNFGGEGRKVTEKQVKGGKEKEEETFKWEMKLTEKK